MGFQKSYRAGAGVTTNALTDCLDIVKFIIWGTLPDPNWDEVSARSVSATEKAYDFFYKGILEFTVTVTDPDGEWNATTEDFRLRGFEDDSGWKLTEDDFNREFEDT